MKKIRNILFVLPLILFGLINGPFLIARIPFFSQYFKNSDLFFGLMFALAQSSIVLFLYLAIPVGIICGILILRGLEPQDLNHGSKKFFTWILLLIYVGYVLFLAFSLYRILVVQKDYNRQMNGGVIPSLPKQAE